MLGLTVYETVAIQTVSRSSRRQVDGWLRSEERKAKSEETKWSRREFRPLLLSLRCDNICVKVKHFRYLPTVDVFRFIILCVVLGNVKCSRRAKTPGKVTKVSSKESIAKDPVQVFCRIRKRQNSDSESCMQVISPTCVCLAPPRDYRGNNYKPINYTFREVFDQDTVQNDVSPLQQRFASVCACKIIENVCTGV